MIRKIPKISIKGAEGACTLLNDAILSLCNFEGAGDIQVSETGTGRKIEKAGDGKRMVQLTNNANPYTATDVYATPSGGWTPTSGGLAFTGVYEDNLQNGLLNQVVEIEPGYRSDWRFNFIRYGKTGDMHGNLGDCCPNPPLTLNLTSNDPTKNNGFYPNRTIMWGAPPCVGPPNPGYYSTTPLPNAFPGITTWYYVTCVAGHIKWQTIATTGPGSCAVASNPSYSFSFVGRTCSPLFWTNVAASTGLDTSQIFTISG